MDLLASPPFLLETFTNDIYVDIKSDSHSHYPYHHHDGYEIYLFSEGDINFYIDKECYSPEPGTLFLIHPDEFHRVQLLSSQRYSRICIYLLPAYLDKLSTLQTDLGLCFEPQDNSPVCMTRLSGNDLFTFTSFADKLSKLQGSHAYGDDLRKHMTAIQLLLFLNQLFRQKAPFTKNIMPKIVMDTMAYVEQHLSEDFSIEKLSQSLFHNRSYISRIFRETTGTTLQHYIIGRRILLAKQLLENGESVSNTCYQSGFRNYSNFIRTFTKNVGVSPLHYQKDFLNKTKSSQTNSPQ